MFRKIAARRLIPCLLGSRTRSSQRETERKARFRPKLEGLEEFIMPSAVFELSTPTSNSGPIDIAPDPTTGGLIFAEFYAGKMGRVSATGSMTEVSLSGVTSTPADVSVTSDGTAWLTGWDSPVVARVDSNNTVTSISISGSGDMPNGSCVGPDGFVWFTTWSGGRIGKINPSDNSVTEYYISSSALPCDIVAGLDGKIWFTEYAANKVVSINTDGTGATEYSLGSGANPIGLAPGTDGKIYVADSGTSQISVVTPGSGVTTYNLASGSVPWSVTQGPDGAVWFAESGTGKVGRIDTAGTITETALPTSGSTPTGVAPLAPTSTTPGQIWVTESNAGQLAFIQANAAPRIVDFTAEALGGGLYRFSGKVIDEMPNGLTITFGGVPTMVGKTTTTASDGTFSLTVQLETEGSDGGNVTATTVDMWGASSNVATVSVTPGG
jgi:virginiamycin B lyase